MANPQQIQQYVNQAMGLMQQGEFERALSIFHALEKAGMQDFRLFRATGGAYERLQQPQKACQYLARSLELNPEQPDLYLALAKMHTQMESWPDARRWYDMALQKEQSDALVISYARFLLMDAIGEPQEALRLLVNTAGKSTNTVALGLLKVQAFRQLGEKEKELQQLQTLLASSPDSKDVHISLAWYYKSVNHNELAEKHYNEAAQHPHATDTDAENYILFLLATDALDEACHSLNQALQRFTQSRKLLRLQASLRYETGEQDYLGGYESAPVTDLPAAVAFDYLDQCIKGNLLERAENLMVALKDSHHRSPYYLQRRALLHYERGEYATAIDTLNHIMASAPDNSTVLELMVKALFANGDYDASQHYLSTLLRAAPADQYYWALQATQWRLTKDERYNWLYDTDTLVKSVTLHCPHGFSSTQSFLRELKGELEALHTMKKQPLEQSLVKGTQTTGNLFDRAHPLFQSLKSALFDTVTEALSTLPADTSHPTLRYAGQRFDFATSWSVRLSDQGFHVSHVHPKGWYSSAFYVDVPDGVGEASKAGWLHLGKPGIATADDISAEKWLKPEPGKLALFPSYMWHGTAPFESEDHRLSVAFDIHSKGGDQ